ncbi:MAG: NAD(P)/FAD-dependent oxidoreductase [Cyclobacteriaceae bacterium]|nr:NAD(P)/FAD-dependent oxidoreductase [Cyclobacteriaceae bacterium SS2]
MKSSQVIIIGGGISGLTNAILLSRNGLKVLLIEKNKYPFHRVCGEYISNEVIPFLENLRLFPTEIGPSDIKTLMLSSPSGKHLEKELDLGGFGISRFRFDEFLAIEARKSGVEILENITVKEVKSAGDKFILSDGSEDFVADFVIGAQGKRSSIDKRLDRDFLKRRSPYVGVKYHLKGNLADHTIALHNFDGGYCGVNKIEDEKFNLCYLVHREKVKKMGGVQQCEERVLLKNPWLREIFENAEFLFEKPLIINEVAFSSKGLIKNRLMFSGDAAGTIAPFSGNGMAMAIRSAKFLSESILNHWDRKPDHDRIFNCYKDLWQKEFSSRISRGRGIQRLFGDTLFSELSVMSGRAFPFLLDPLIKMTHGRPFS